MSAIQARRRTIMSAWVFAIRRGRPISPGMVTQAFRRALGRAGIADLRFNDLRHTVATRLCQPGVNLYVVKRLLRHQTRR